jgi:CRP-like cAMP-binding protein
MVSIGQRNARSRVAHLFCELGLRLEAAGLGTATAFELPMSQEQLGDALGLTAVHVNRSLQTMGKAGLVKRDKRWVQVPDWQELASVGDFDAQYLHLANGEATVFVK